MYRRAHCIVTSSEKNILPHIRQQYSDNIHEDICTFIEIRESHYARRKYNNKISRHDVILRNT
jgi:hypothetical protein